jgi:hypothetical protein
MNRLLRTLITLVWSLWFGGLVMLFCSVQSLFHQFADRRDIAGEAAAGIFRFFAYYHLALAAAALLTSFAWRMTAPPKRKTLVFSLFAFATLAAIYVSAFLVPQMERLRAAGLTHGDKFRQLHGISMGVFLLETVLVFAAGQVLPFVPDCVLTDQRASVGADPASR